MKEKDAEINIFAAFFGRLLAGSEDSVGLRHHDLHRKNQGSNFALTRNGNPNKIQMVEVCR